jgi:hypothetical protein
LVLDLLEYRGKFEGIIFYVMKVSSMQKDILFGTILGDAYLQKTGEKNARLRLEHGAGQKDYLFWKVNNLSQFFQGKPKYLERVHPITKRTYQYWRHQSQSTPLFGKLRKIFYQDGRKIIPQNIEEFMTPRSIAVWYMDDGYYYERDHCSYLYLGNVEKEEAELIQDAFAKKFNLIVRILAKKKGFAVYFPPQEVGKLKEIIQYYVLDEFKYKLPS